MIRALQAVVAVLVVVFVVVPLWFLLFVAYRRKEQ